MNDTIARLFIYVGDVQSQAQTQFRYLQNPLRKPSTLLQWLSHSWLREEPIHSPLTNRFGVSQGAGGKPSPSSAISKRTILFLLSNIFSTLDSNKITILNCQQIHNTIVNLLDSPGLRYSFCLKLYVVLKRNKIVPNRHINVNGESILFRDKDSK